ncbi:MAG: hypothetical protein ABFS14_02350 [Gemmatimonadota bacterium]
MRILEDYEAKLRPPPGVGAGRGKVEWERYGDGSEVFYARFRKLDLRDDAVVEVRLDGAVLGNISISGGAGRLKFDSKDGREVPKAVTGQVVEVVYRDMVVLTGIFEPD